MKKRSLMILFIFSFLCVVFTTTYVCNTYIDEEINNFLKNTITNNFQTLTIIQIAIGAIFFSLFTLLPKSIISIFAIIFLTIYYIVFKNNFGILNPIFTIMIARTFANCYSENFKEDINKKIENVLGKYLSKDISKKILKNNKDITLGGKHAEITVMFADIRGFTSLSETRKAEEVSALLNEYFSELEPIIEKYNGIINKFIGDAVLVVFGDPTPDKNHAQNAIKCAIELRNKVKQIKEKWANENKPKIDIGIGINTGEAFIGNVGSSNRFEYTVIGDAVNIASRLEDYNKIYKTNLLISENTYNKISQIVDVIKIKEVAIKGKQKKINIYEVLRITEQ